MSDAVNYRVIQRRDLSREDCPWFNPRYGSEGPSRDQVLLSILGDQPVCYALFEKLGDIELKYIENAPSESGKGYAIGIVREVLQRYPDRVVWGAAHHPWDAATHPRTPNLFRKAGFSSPWEVEKERGGFRMSGVWVRFPCPRVVCSSRGGGSRAVGSKKENDMAKNEQTSKHAGTAASKTLRGTGTKKDARTAAASDLTQRPDKKKSKKK